MPGSDKEEIFYINWLDGAIHVIYMDLADREPPSPKLPVPPLGSWYKIIVVYYSDISFCSNSVIYLILVFIGHSLTCSCPSISKTSTNDNNSWFRRIPPNTIPPTSMPSCICLNPF